MIGQGRWEAARSIIMSYYFTATIGLLTLETPSKKTEQQTCTPESIIRTTVRAAVTENHSTPSDQSESRVFHKVLILLKLRCAVACE